MHIAIIPDGNRRWAARRNFRAFFGYLQGIRKLEQLIEYLFNRRVKELTIYGMSLDNFLKRSYEEKRYLFILYVKAFRRLIRKNKIRKLVKVNVIGFYEFLPKKLQREIRIVRRLTRKNNRKILNMCLAYSSRLEIVDAIKRISEKIGKNKFSVRSINKETINENLWIKSEPDIIVRTSEKRLSDFLLWQGNSAKLVFIDKLFPDILRIDLWRAIKNGGCGGY